MTIHVPIKEAKNRLSELARKFEAGERIIVTRNGVEVFEMVKPRRGGIDFQALEDHLAERGPIVTWVAPDFDDPLPDSFWFPED